MGKAQLPVWLLRIFFPKRVQTDTKKTLQFLDAKYRRRMGDLKFEMQVLLAVNQGHYSHYNSEKEVKECGLTIGRYESA